MPPSAGAHLAWMLGGSWVVLSRVISFLSFNMGYKLDVESPYATLLITTHEPPNPKP